MEGFFIFFILILVVVAVPLSLSKAKRADEAWSRAGSQLGLQLQPRGFLSSRRLYGKFDSFGVNIDTYTKGSGNNRRTFTRFRLSYSSLSLGLGLTEEGFFAGVTKFFGAQDIEVGDHVFDRGVVVKGFDPERVRLFLTPARQLRIRRFFSSHRGAQINDTEILWPKRGVVSNSAELVRVVQAMARLATALTQEGDRALQEALNEQDQGHTENAIRVLKEHRGNHAGTEHIGDPDEAFLEGELLYLADQPQEAQLRFDDAQSVAPDDLEIGEWAAALHAGVPDPVGAATNDPKLDSGESAAAICRTLFESGWSSFRITREFEQHYAGKSVRWTGTLRRVERYSYDLVFGSGPGCRAIIDICSLDSNVGAQLVSAIAQYPENSEAELRAAEGETISFSGELLKVDGLMRKFFLRTDGIK